MTIKFENVRFTEDYIGPHLLESITKGLYVDPRHVIREYVQNEVEADPPATLIKVHIREKEISIWGNGGGMNRDMILNKALKIGFSTKDPTKHFGFRGIGIWSGVAVCDEIIISTKRSGEDKEYFLRINAKNIRKEYEEKVKKLTQVLTENVEVGEIPAPLEKHGTHVRLVNILDESKKFLLDLDEVLRYMRLTLPVEFHPNFPYKKVVTQWLKENVPNYLTVKIFLNDQQIFRGPFIKELDYPKHQLLKTGKDLLAFVWYCMHKYNRSIPDQESRGLIYKKFGFTIGDRNICLKWWKKDQHLISWCVGEIHILHPYILPNAERTDLESGREKELLLSQLKNIEEEIRTTNRIKSHLFNLKERIGNAFQLTQKPIFVSQDDKEEKISNLRSLLNYLGKAEKHSFTKNYADERLKKRLKRAISHLEKLLEVYREVSITPEKKVEIKEKVEKKAIPVVTITKQLPKIPSLFDLLSSMELTSELRTVLECVEEVIDEYFANDPQLSSEIKYRLAECIKKRMG